MTGLRWRAWGTVAAVLCALLVYAPGCVRAQDGGGLAVTAAQNTRALRPYDVFELTFRHGREYANPFFDVTLEVTFHSPTHKTVTVGGFFYGSSDGPKIQKRMVAGPRGPREKPEYLFDKHDLWKARFAPNEVGEWRYQWIFTNREGQKATGGGTFQCVESRVHNHGFVRQNPNNPFRWVFDDGTPYFPIGLQEGWGDADGTGTYLDTAAMEGPFRLDRTNLVQLLPGPLFVRGPSMNPQNSDVFLRRYSEAGFDLYRFSQRNNTDDLYTDLDHYLIQQAAMTDELLQRLHQYGFRIVYGLFGYQPVFNDHPEDAEAMTKVKRFIKYSVDRWGVYADFWEFLNEQKASDGWYAIMTPYLRSIDPYRHPITTSWQRPELPGIEVNAPHDYYGSDPNPDLATANRAKSWKAAGKPVIVGEHGNSVSSDPTKRPPGHGGVWYPESAQRMRVRNWVAFFNEIVFIFWNTSYARDGHFMNIWLGPQERQYVHAMQDFVRRLDAGIRMAPVTVSDPRAVRAWGLRSEKRAAAYLYHFANQGTPTTGLTLTVDVPQAARGYWYAPEEAAILGSFDTAAGTQTVPVPPFRVDLALLITPKGAPDIDHDGKPNDVDDDDDNDGVPDVKDAFPLEAEEWADQDGDLIGDNLDADLNGDGEGDDSNHNGVPDCQEMDFDGDGVLRTHAVPWDAFPLDPKEWRDTDGDGIGDNADLDDDGDGYSDAEEARAETDPLNRLSFPAP
jgi:hypothetical protein